MTPDAHADGGRRSFWKTPAIITALILGIPLLRDVLANGLNWDIRGFLLVGAFGTLLFGIGLTFQMAIRRLATPLYRVAVGIALLTAFILVWGNFIQGADDVNPAAFYYFVVPMVGMISAAIARFRPDGMARVMFVTALAQAIVLAIAWVILDPSRTPWTAAVWRGFGGNAFDCMLFVGSALLFRRAARGKSTSGVA